MTNATAEEVALRSLELAMDSQRYRQAVTIRRLLSDFERRCRETIRMVRSVRFEQNVNLEVFICSVRFRYGDDQNYSLLFDELRMEDAVVSLTCWLESISGDIRERARLLEERYAPQRAMQRSAMRAYQEQILEMFTSMPSILDQRTMMREMGIDFDVIGVDLARDSGNTEADKKARELFKTTAGEAAYNALAAGKAIPIRGSQGTKYQLYPQATYCVERESDGARLCAVVPGVPLWDHLLGIKLMVEHDEPTFLATANVAAGITVSHRAGRLYYDEWV